jgi:adenylosuccinate lyase
MTTEELESVMDPKNFIGRAPSQTEEFVKDFIQPILSEKAELLGLDVEINV